MKSEWVDCAINVNSSLLANQDVAKTYFETNIDEFGEGSVNITEWIAALSKMEIFNEFDVWEMKRIFYVIMFSVGNDGDMLRMDKKDFGRFFSDDLNVYQQIYRKFIKILEDEIPDLILNDDGYDDTCFNCGLAGDLICCDGCPHVFHLSCVDLIDVPLASWYCDECCEIGSMNEDDGGISNEEF